MRKISMYTLSAAAAMLVSTAIPVTSLAAVSTYHIPFANGSAYVIGVGGQNCFPGNIGQNGNWGQNGGWGQNNNGNQHTIFFCSTALSPDSADADVSASAVVGAAVVTTFSDDFTEHPVTMDAANPSTRDTIFIYLFFITSCLLVF